MSGRLSAGVACLALAAGVLLVGAPVALGDAADAAKKRKPTAKSCPAGSTPIFVKRGRKAVIKRDRRGRLRCRAVKRSAVRAPAATPSLQVGRVADVLDSVADIKPGSFKKMERKIGKRRSDRLLSVALRAWRDTAGAAAAGPRAGAAENETKTFSEGGADGTASFGIDPVEGERSGFKAHASAELKVGRDAIVKYAGDRLPADVTGASAKVDVSFEDVAKTCPTAKGEVPGTLRGKGSITVKVGRSDGPPIEVRLSADVDTTYTAQMGEDGNVKSIDDVEVQTKFQTGGTGSSTETYRGRVLGTGFGRKGFLDAPSGQGTAALERDWGHIDQNNGGVFGPHGSWRYGRGFPTSDLRTVDNIKAMAATNIASQVLTMAAIEYLRKVTLERIEKGACGYYVLVDINTDVETAGYHAYGKLRFNLIARPVSGSTTRWRGSAPAQYADVYFNSKNECPYIDVVNTPGTFTIDLELQPSGSLQATWSAAPSVSASVDCPPDDSDPPNDPPPIPGMAGPSLVGVSPTSFVVPADHVQPIGGGIDGGGGDGFFDSGSILISPNK